MRTRLVPMAGILILISTSIVATRADEYPQSSSAAQLPVVVLAWEFESSDGHPWQPNAQVSDVSITDGVLSARTVDWDPFFSCRDLAIDAAPEQYVVIRIRANRAGIGELFWSGQLEGKYGGLTEEKKLRFSVAGGDRWQEIVLLPFWHPERVIRQLRLDLYEGAEFKIDWIRIMARPPSPTHNATLAWELSGDVSSWRIHPNASELLAPSSRIDVGDRPWVTVEIASDREVVASILWARPDAPGLQTEEFPLRADGRPHSYCIRVADNAAWKGPLAAFGIRLPQEAHTRLNRIEIAQKPSGPGELDVGYFGFEDGVNRAGRASRLLAQVTNLGGSAQGIRQLHVDTPQGMRLLSEPQPSTHPGIEHGDVARFYWEIVADKPGRYPIRLTLDSEGRQPPEQQATLEFTEAPSVPRTEYVPEPRPIHTDVVVCAYYFPGWESDAKWDCVRKVAPCRKPLLGYYDESNPTCVDWQIKWAVENGISCFLVDWYWVQGRQQLTHWFDAYRRAKYRDSLKVAIMWANHNPPGTHSPEDWLKVASHWIEQYFTLPGYYRIDGKPAVFIWDPKGIRNDLGGSQAVREAFDKSKEMARAAGFGGITLIALGYDFSESHVQALTQEGYFGVTTYHEWGSGIDGQVDRKLFQYEDVVRESSEAWNRKNQMAGDLVYYPLVDTGWDSRPWHGHKSMVIQGRTPKLFEDLLGRANAFCKDNGKSLLILGPVNEWGEGSYIEPCTEFGFEMLEAVRRTFATEPSEVWPVNVSPRDVGLGPYDFPSPQSGEQPPILR
jgi:hypothetical protein